MKNTIKVFDAMRSIAIIALVALIGFSSCGGGGDDDPDPTPTFTSVEAFATWLAEQPDDNTEETAYHVKLNVSDLGGASTATGSVGRTLRDNAKYVSLDLSGSTFTSIENFAFYSCNRLASVTFQGTIATTSFSSSTPFPGNLRTKFYETDSANGTPGTYTTSDGSTWAKQP